MSRIRTVTGIVPMLVAAAASTLALAGCSSGGSSTHTQATPAAPSAHGSPAAGGYRQGAGGRPPGVSGLIAAVSGKTLQVQGNSGQTAVTYTSKTKITETGTGSASSLATGLCATVRSAGTSGASPSSRPTAVTATTVLLRSATNGSCSNGFTGSNRSGSSNRSGGFNRSGGTSRPTHRPSGAPTAGQQRDFGILTSGKVTKVSTSSFVVAAADRGSSQTTPVTVTVNSTTSYSVTTTAKPSAVKTGECVSAFGKSDDTGAVTATTMVLSKAAKSATAGQGTCTAGFGGGFRFGNRTSGNGNQASGTSNG